MGIQAGRKTNKSNKDRVLFISSLHLLLNYEAWWPIGRVEAFRSKGRGFESRTNRHAGTLGKSLTHNCLWRFGMKLRHSIRAVSGAPLSSSGLEEALYKNSMNE